LDVKIIEDIMMLQNVIVFSVFIKKEAKVKNRWKASFRTTFQATLFSSVVTLFGFPES